MLRQRVSHSIKQVVKAGRPWEVRSSSLVTEQVKGLTQGHAVKSRPSSKIQIQTANASQRKILILPLFELYQASTV